MVQLQIGCNIPLLKLQCKWGDQFNVAKMGNWKLAILVQFVARGAYYVDFQPLGYINLKINLILGFN